MHFFVAFLTLLNVLVGLLCFNFHTGKQGTKYTTFERFNNTCGERNLNIICNYTGLRPQGHKVYMNSTLTVKEDINSDPKVTIRIDRCKNKENLDTCEHVYDHNMDSYCTMINSTGGLWGNFFSYYVPEYKCPIKKGVYRATDGLIDGSALLLFPLDAWFWKIKLEVYDKATNKIISCTIVEAHVAKIA